MPRRSFAEELRRRREAAGLSQADVARILNVKQQQVSKWESGTTMPGVGRLPALAKALGVDVADLYALLAEAAQTEAASVKHDRDLLMERLKRFTDRYEELGHTYTANHELLERLMEKNDAIMRRLDELERRYLRADGEPPPPSPPRRRRP